MKKFLTLTIAALAITTAPALAGEHKGEHHKGKMFEMHDTDGNGVVTKAEFLEHAEERFSKMDTDGDGEVTKAESEAAMEKWKEMKKEKRMEKKKGSTDDSE